MTASTRRRFRFPIVLALFGLLTGTLICAQVVQRDWPSERPPRPLEPRPVVFPPYEVRTLENGLTVVVVRHTEQPVVSLRMLVRAGSAQDPEDKPGVAAMVATLLDQGTTTRSATEIADYIDFIGGGLGAGAGTDLSYANAILLKSSFDKGLDLLADVIRNPAFAPEELERQREQVLSGLKVSYQDPDFVASVVIDRLIFGFHPYGRPANGTPESLAAITREDLVEFHKRWYHPNNSLLAIVGDIGIDQAFAGAERVFGSWPRGEIPQITSVDPPEPTRRVVVVDRPNAVQTEIRVGQLAIRRNHQDYMPLNLAVKILGGEGGNRLQGVLRSERGLTYGASADMDAFQRAGAIVADTDTRTETTAEALRLTVDEFFRLQREPVSRLELGGAQAFLAGNFPLTIETPDAIALQVLNALFYGLDLKELPTYPERVNAVSPEDIQRVAKAYLRPNRLSVVLVGDASKFLDDLKGVGFDNVEVVKLDELDLTAVNLRRSQRVASSQPSAAR
ncbi:MAG TPA: pitrilysin family protein [Vicinamibacterales bacterium]